MKIAAVAAVAALALASVASAQTNTTQQNTNQQNTNQQNNSTARPPNPNSNSCFGQARSEGAKTFQPMGQIIRQRAQAGTNAEMNREFKETCQAATPQAPK